MPIAASTSATRPNASNKMRTQRGHIARTADDERHLFVSEPRLPRRYVYGPGVPERQRALLHIAHHADNGVVRRPGRTDLHALPEGLLIGKLGAGQRFADQNRWRRGENVAGVEQAAATQRNAHRLKVIGTNCISKSAPSAFALLKVRSIFAIHISA